MPVKLISNQRGVKFSYCPSPVTVDKSADWGAGNIQEFPNGVFLKHDSIGIITHGVQPNDTKSGPVGWIMEQDQHGNATYRKKDIWMIEGVDPSEKPITVKTLDGTMDYVVKEPSLLVCQDKNGEPDAEDTWIISEKEAEKLYDWNQLPF